MLNEFTYRDDAFQLTTVNRQRTFYYRLTKPIDVWGNYHTQIAFFDEHNDLIYHRQDCFAHALQVDNSLEFVKWSNTGEQGFFYEYKRGLVTQGGIYDYILIDLADKVVYRVDLYKYEHKFLDELQNGFAATIIIKQIEGLGINKEPCYTDKIVISPLNWLTGVDRWKPSAEL